MDVFASGGYYSELIGSVVGDSGEVLLHNNRGFSAWGVNVLNDRFDGRTLDNVKLLIQGKCRLTAVLSASSLAFLLSRLV